MHRPCPKKACGPRWGTRTEAHTTRPGVGLQSSWLSPLAADEIDETVGKGFPGTHSRCADHQVLQTTSLLLVPLVALRGQQ